MSSIKGLCCLAKLIFEKYWFWILWSGICIEAFRGEYLHYKLAPQFYYLRKMLGCGISISRGTAAVLNVSAVAIVLTTCRNMYSLISIYLPSSVNKKLYSIVVSSKSNHLAVAGTIVLTSILHTASHIANAVNSSKNFLVDFPAANLATFKGENPSLLIFTTVPGITGILMMIILILLCVTSLRFVRRRNYERFYYTHYCGVIYLILLAMHPISGVIKAVSNIDSHHPSCIFLREPKSTQEEVVEEGIEFSDFTKTYLYITKFKKFKDDLRLPQHYKDEVQQRYMNVKKGKFENEFSNTTQLMKIYKKNNNQFIISNQEATIFPESEDKAILSHEKSEISVVKNPNNENIVKPNVKKPFSKEFNKPKENDDGYSICGELDKLFSGKSQLHTKQEISFMTTLKNKISQNDIVKHQNRSDFFEKKISDEHKQQAFSKESCHLPPVFTSVQTKAWIWMCSALILWLLEFSIGYLRGRGKVKLLKVVYYPHCEVAELSFTKEKFACYPGQFVLLRCPQISMFQWHPFTIARCPADNDGILTVVMTTKGNWCKKMIDHLQSIFSTPVTPSKYTSLLDVERRHYRKAKLITNGSNDGSESFNINNLKASLVLNSPSSKCAQEINKISLREESGEFIQHKKTCFITKGDKPIPVHNPNCSLTDNHHYQPTEKFNSTKLGIKLQKCNFMDRPDGLCEFCDKSKIGEYKDNNELVSILPHCRILYTVDEHQSEEFCGRFYMKGPFNSVNEKLFSYDVVIGIAGGIGITPFVASLTHISQVNENNPTRIHIVWVLRNLQLITTTVSLFQSLSDKFWNNHQEDRMELRFHCTSKSVTNETFAVFKKNYPYLGARLYRGRPDWRNMFEVWMDCYKRSRVGVFCCGPKSLSKKINEHILLAARKGINFAFHHENFS